MKIHKSSELKPDKLKILVYGESGSGKTHFGGTCPKPLFFDFDGGMLTLRKEKEIAFVDLTGMSTKAEKVWPDFMEALKEYGEDEQFETLIIDSLTTAATACMDYVLSLNRRTGQNPQLQDWLTQMNELKEMIKLVKATKKHVIVLAHEQVEKDEITGRIWMLPLITGKMARQIGLYFDEVYHSEAKQKKDETIYSLLTKPTGLLTAKTRIGFPEMNITPDFKWILGHI